MVIYNESVGKQLVIGVVDVNTGSGLINEVRFTTVGRPGSVYVVRVTPSRGMPVTTAEITVRYAGKRINFDPPAVVRWR